MARVFALCALLLLAGCSKRFCDAQMCFAPPVADLNDAAKSGVTSPDTVYLYTALFNSLVDPCNGELVHFDVCYQFTDSQDPQQAPAVVFQLLILEDRGSEYSVVAAVEEREDRDCFVESQCCKSLELSYSVQLQANYSLAIIIPATPGGNLFSLSTTSLGNVANTRGQQRLPTTRGSLIFKSQLWLSNTEGPVFITDKSVRVVIDPDPLMSTVPPTPTSVSLLPSARATPSLNPEQGSRFSGLQLAILAGTTGGFLVLCLIITAVVAVLGISKRIKQQKQLSRSIKNSHINKCYVRSEDQGSKKPGTGDGPDSTEEKQDGEAHEYEATDVFVEMKEQYEVLSSAPSIHSQLGSSVMSGTARCRLDSSAPLLRRDSLSSYRHESVMDTENIFEDPATDEKALYAQYKRINISHVTRDSIILQEGIGSGQFGTVQRGVWKSQSEGEVDVAVKTLNKGADKVKFLQEAAIMGQFQHPSIVKLHGVVIIGEPKMIILELLEKGDLSKVLLTLRPSNDSDAEQGLSHTLLSYCRQVASGMNYLAGKAFVHRDLAARNILVSEDGDIKIADFGMSRDILEERHYISQGGKIPVKWTAPEAIHFKKYSAASDVWSFGAVMYEIWSLGHRPFEGYTNPEAISMLDSGVRLPPPPGCPRAIYALMIKCWHSAASERPDFPRIVQHLSLSDTKLLKWAEQDRTAAPAEATSLGAELKAAVDLYKELQNAYLNSKL